MTTIKMGDSYSGEDGATPDPQADELEGQEEAKEVPAEGKETDTPGEPSTPKEPDTKPEPTSDETEPTNTGEGEGVGEREIQGLIAQEKKLDDELSKIKQQLSQRITEQRRERRELREELSRPLLVDEKVDLSDVAESDIATIEKVLRAKGYVHKDELQGMTYKQQVDSYKDQWLEVHPEYLPENDVDDKLWQALNSELNAYYKAPQNPKDITKILDRIHSSISKGSLPIRSSANTKSAQERVRASGKSAAAGGVKGQPAGRTAINRSAFVGFSAEELDELEQD